jgi:HSP20 family molecular chaperone IbpA
MLMKNQKTNFAQRSCTAGTFSQTARDQQLRQQEQQKQQKLLGVRGREKALNPPAELSESYEWMRLAVDFPGVQLKDLDVNINHGVLTIEGVRRTMSVDGSVCVKKQKLSRHFAIDTDVVDVQKVAANLKFGVLTIQAPKKSKPNRVRVDVTEDDEGVASYPNVMVNVHSNMSVAPVTTTPHTAASIQAAPTPHIAAFMQAAPTPLTSDEKQTSSDEPTALHNGSARMQ